MARHHELVQRLTEIAQRPAISTDEEIKELAEEYAELCSAANKSLGEVRLLLAQGLRVEAVTRARDQDPDLLDLVMVLDFLYVRPWNELCRQKMVPLSPILALETAAALNEAYTAQQPLEGLLTQHRLLALAKASLRDRLLVLRQISDKDPNNDAWTRDIAALEKSRVRELDSDVEAAGAKNDLTEIANLHREINNTQWQISVPEHVQAKVSTLHRALRRLSLLAGFEVLVNNLDIAHQGNDLDAMRQLLTLAEETAVQIEPPVDAELYSQLEGPRQVLAAAASEAEAQAQFEIAVSQLRHCLATDISGENLVSYRTVIESRKSAVEQFGFVFPETLYQLTARKLKQIDNQQRRTFVLKLFAASFTVIVLGAAVTAIIVFLNASSAREAEVAKYTTYFKQGNYEQIIESFAKLRREGSDYANDQDILKIQDEAQARFVAAKANKARLQGLFEKLEKNGFENFSIKDYEELKELAELLQDHEMLERLRKFHFELELFRSRLEQEQQNAYADRYRVVALAVEALATKGALLTSEDLDKAKGDLELLLNDYPGLANRPLIESLLRHIAEMRTQMKNMATFTNLKNELTVSCGVAAQYANALRNLYKFLQEHPLDATMKNDIEFVLLESNYWAGVVAWGQFYSVQFQPELIIKSPLKLAAEQAKASIEQGTLLAQMFPELEVKSEYLERRDMLLSITLRPQADIVGLRADLRKHIGSTQAVLIANKDTQKVTYNLQDLLPWETFSAKKVVDKIVFKGFANVENETTEYGVRERDVIYYGPAPHTTIQQEIFSVLDDLNSAGKSWEEVFLDALDVLFDDAIITFPNQFRAKIGNKQTVPLSAIQRLLISRLLLGFATEHSVALSESLTSALRELETADVDLRVDFVAPTTDQSRLQNRNAEETLKALKGKLEQSRPEVLRQLDNFSKTPKSAVVWVGWIDVRDGGYTVRFSDGKPKSGAMFTVISNGTDTSEATIIELGKANGGVLQIPKNTVGSNFKHRFGRPVFTYSVTTSED